MAMRQEPIIVQPTATHPRRRIIVTGDLDIATIGALQAELDAIFTQPVTVEIDLSAVTFFSCAAAQTLRNAHLNRPGSLTVTGASRPTRRLLEIMHLQALLAAAIASAAA